MVLLKQKLRKRPSLLSLQQLARLPLFLKTLHLSLTRSRDLSSLWQDPRHSSQTQPRTTIDQRVKTRETAQFVHA
jgi:hypothetical protein